MMNMDEAAKYIVKIAELNTNEWSQADQLRYWLAVLGFAEKIKPLVDKYDMTKPFKFEIRRLDELL